MSVWVKICGLKDARSLQTVAQCGADAVGVVFAPGSRRLTPEQARLLLREAPRGLEKVGVFVDEPRERVLEVADQVGLDTVQLHGRESPDYCRRLQSQYRVIKSIPVGPGGPLLDPDPYRVDALLLDTAVPGRSGGSGQSFSWRLVRDRNWPAPLVLAGGLDAGNVVSGLEMLQLRGVDTSSGVESHGVKDPQRIKEFVQTIRRWEHAHAGTAR